jgi:hypothetical protein
MSGHAVLAFQKEVRQDGREDHPTGVRSGGGGMAGRECRDDDKVHDRQRQSGLLPATLRTRSDSPGDRVPGAAGQVQHQKTGRHDGKADLMQDWP